MLRNVTAHPSLAKPLLALLAAALLAACAGPELAKPVPAERVVLPAPVPRAPESPPPAPEPPSEVGTIGDLPPVEAVPLMPPPLSTEDGEIVPRPGCRLAADPIACEKRQRASEQALAECQGVAPHQKGDCMRDAMVRNEDCSQSRSVRLCEARKYAYQTCRGTYGKERRQCLVDAMPLDNCATAKGQKAIERCEASKKALAVCKVFEDGLERRACLYRELAPFIAEDAKRGED
jgi:hypothetical protein